MGIMGAMSSALLVASFSLTGFWVKSLLESPSLLWWTLLTGLAPLLPHKAVHLTPTHSIYTRSHRTADWEEIQTLPLWGRVSVEVVFIHSLVCAHTVQTTLWTGLLPRPRRHFPDKKTLCEQLCLASRNSPGGVWKSLPTPGCGCIICVPALQPPGPAQGPEQQQRGPK